MATLAMMNSTRPEPLITLLTLVAHNRCDNEFMRTSALVVATALFFSGVGAAQATSPTPTPSPAVVTAICASKVDAKIRKVTVGKCTTNEWSLGTTKISRGKKRPEGLRKQMKARFKAAQLAAKLAGHQIGITSGWRSLATQTYLFKRAVKRNGSVAAASKWVLPPKISNHPWGIAIDVNYGSGKKSGAKWLQKNGYKYGLCRRYDNEWWHFEPLVAPGTKCPKREPYAKA